MERSNVRTMDECGRIALPKEVQQVLGWEPNSTLELWLDVSNDALVIKRHAYICLFCGAATNLNVYQKKHICTFCVETFRNL